MNFKNPTEFQEFTRMRNATKGRITGMSVMARMCSHCGAVTVKERNQLLQASKQMRRILDFWEKSTILIKQERKYKKKGVS